MGDAFAALTKLQWKLCNSVPAIKVFFSQNQVKTEKKKKKQGLRRLYSGFGTIFGCNL